MSASQFTGRVCHNNNNNNMRFVERHGAIALEALADRSSQLARNRREKTVLSLALNNVRESQFRTDVGREFQTDGAAVLKERLLKDVRLKETCSSGADDDHSDSVLLRVVMWRSTQSGSEL